MKKLLYLFAFIGLIGIAGCDTLKSDDESDNTRSDENVETESRVAVTSETPVE